MIGFRSSKYDLLVVRSKLLPKLGLHIHNKKDNTYTSRKYVIKRCESYPCISTKKYKFLDISEYVGPISYVQFLKSMKVETGRKLFFPYEAAKSVSDLYEIGLPDMHSPLWFSTIKQKSVLNDGYGTVSENYNLISCIWDDRGMTCLMDLLQEFNNCDVGPFISALEAFQNIFQSHEINVFVSNAISTPGLSRK